MTNELATRPPPGGQIQAVKTYIEARLSNIQTVLGNQPGMAQRWMRTLLQSVAKNETLLGCPPDTLYMAAFDAARLGLEVGGPLAHAHLVPIWNGKTKRNEAQMWLGYRGVLKILHEDTSLKLRVHAPQIVRSGDNYSPPTRRMSGGRYGLEFHHEARDSSDEIVAAYCVYEIDGSPDVVWLWRTKLDEVKAKALSKCKQDWQIAQSPWTTSFPEMCAKTTILRLKDIVPFSPDTAAKLATDGEDREPESAMPPMRGTGPTADDKKNFIASRAQRETVVVADLPAPDESQPDAPADVPETQIDATTGEVMPAPSIAAAKDKYSDWKISSEELHESMGGQRAQLAAVFAAWAKRLKISGMEYLSTDVHRAELQAAMKDRSGVFAYLK